MATRRKRTRTYGVGRKYRRGKRWWVAIYIDGEEKRFPTHSSDEREADELLAQKLRERSRGEILTTSLGFTIGELLDEYLERRKRAPGTQATYQSQINIHLKPYFGELPVHKLTTDKLTDYREYRSKQEIQQGHNAKTEEAQTRRRRKVGQTTINRELTLLRAALRDLSRRRPQMLAAVPHFPMESEKGNVRRGFIREKDFVERLYPELPRHLQALSACAFYTGARKSEWFSLDWAQVDFDELLIHFLKTKNQTERDVPIFHGLMLDSLLEAKKVSDAIYPDELPVFAYQGIRLRSIGDAWDKACARAKLEGFLFHDLRRSANRYLRDKGVPQGLRMKIMGHKTASMDLRYGVDDKADMDSVREKVEGSRDGARLKRIK